MFEKILKDVEKVSDFMVNKKMFHHLSLQTHDEAISSYKELVNEKEFKKIKQNIEKNFNFFEELSFNKNFKKEWLNLEKEKQFLLIFHHKNIYSTLRNVFEREELCFTNEKDFVLHEKLPEKFYHIINSNIDSEDIKKNSNDIRRLISERKESINWFELEKIMKENNLISGYMIFFMRFQDRKEEEIKIKKDLMSNKLWQQ